MLDFASPSQELVESQTHLRIVSISVSPAFVSNFFIASIRSWGIGLSFIGCAHTWIASKGAASDPLGLICFWEIDAEAYEVVNIHFMSSICVDFNVNCKFFSFSNWDVNW